MNELHKEESPAAHHSFSTEDPASMLGLVDSLSQDHVADDCSDHTEDCKASHEHQVHVIVLN